MHLTNIQSVFDFNAREYINVWLKSIKNFTLTISYLYLKDLRKKKSYIYFFVTFYI